MSQLKPAREKRFSEIWDCVARAGDQGASARDIAKCLGMGGDKHKPSPHLREMLEQLVKEYPRFQRVEGVVETQRGLANGWRYFIKPEGS